MTMYAFQGYTHSHFVFFVAVADYPTTLRRNVRLTDDAVYIQGILLPVPTRQTRA